MFFKWEMWVYFCSRSGAALFWRRVGEMIGSLFSGIAVRKSEIAASVAHLARAAG
jgi:hypothetical protein